VFLLCPRQSDVKIQFVRGSEGAVESTEYLFKSQNAMVQRGPDSEGRQAKWTTHPAMQPRLIKKVKPAEKHTPKRNGCFSGARNIFNYNAAVSELAWWTMAAIWWGVAACLRRIDGKRMVVHSLSIRNPEIPQLPRTARPQICNCNQLNVSCCSYSRSTFMLY
jgi:hypothetical protein